MFPCVGGPSHNETWEITRGLAQAGTDVLMCAILNNAEIVDWVQGLRAGFRLAVPCDSGLACG